MVDDIFVKTLWKEGYPPIEEHGIIGNMRTVACVASDATIDYFCYPDFDSPTIFASILDELKGGFFAIRASGKVSHKQLYHPDTNVLLSRFLSDAGVAQVVDYMPLDCTTTPDDYRRQWIMREVEVIRGSMNFEIECFPAFNYARDSHIIEIDEFNVRFKSELLTMELHASTNVSWRTSSDNNGSVVGYFSVAEGEKHVFVFREVCDINNDETTTNTSVNEAYVFIPNITQPFSVHLANTMHFETLKYWRRWLSQCLYKGRWREMVERSALTLKLLTYERTGAIVAAATFSLPEAIAGVRNWDYRFTWIRDSAFTLYAFLRLGFRDEADAFMKWIEARCREIDSNDGLQIMYGIRGEKILTEIELTHLDGYRGSKPVRIGNAAYDQLQLDIYGELLDTVYLSNKYATPISYEFWCHVRKLVDWVTKNWQQTDEGIWEVRGGQQAFTYSRLMSWVAIDRGIRLAEKRSFPADITKWRIVRNTIYEEIQIKGFDSDIGSFVQCYGSKSLDASTLIMPLVFFMSPVDPKFIKTLENILRSTSDGGLVSNNLVFRYNANETDDGLPGDEGTFTLCTFWAVEALARAGQYNSKYLVKARLMFEQTIGYANHLGLFAEEIGSRGEALGNFPQAFTHIALISSAFALDRVLSAQ